MLGIVDYKAGNIQSVRHALDFLRIEYVISDTPKNLENTSCLMFPGVGNASYAMERVKKAGFDSFLKERAAQGIPLLGICMFLAQDICNHIVQLVIHVNYLFIITHVITRRAVPEPVTNNRMLSGTGLIDGMIQ